MCNYHYRNAKHPDEMVKYILVELGMFGSCESSTSSDSGDTNGNDCDSIFLSFSQEARS